MKKKSFVVTVLFLSVFSSVFSQTDPKADEILKAVSAKYKSYKSLSATFKVVIDNEKEKTKEMHLYRLMLRWPTRYQ